MMRRFVAWRCRRRTGFGERLVHEVVVPPGPDDRPGERLLAHSRSLYQPRRLGPDSSREDFSLVVGPGGSTLSAVCVGRVSDRGEPREAAWHTIRSFGVKGFPGTAVVEDEIAGTPAWRYGIALNDKALTEWKFAHAGWLFVAGVLRREPDDERQVVDRARSALATWQWIEAPVEDSAYAT